MSHRKFERKSTHRSLIITKERASDTRAAKKATPWKRASPRALPLVLHRRARAGRSRRMCSSGRDLPRLEWGSVVRGWAGDQRQEERAAAPFAAAVWLSLARPARPRRIRRSQQSSGLIGAPLLPVALDRCRRCCWGATRVSVCERGEEERRSPIAALSLLPLAPRRPRHAIDPITAQKYKRSLIPITTHKPNTKNTPPPPPPPQKKKKQTRAAGRSATRRASAAAAVSASASPSRATTRPSPRT